MAGFDQVGPGHVLFAALLACTPAGARMAAAQMAELVEQRYVRVLIS
jgi:uncharacterized OsmC-like protein